jgi:hypothetical protein
VGRRRVLPGDDHRRGIPLTARGSCTACCTVQTPSPLPAQPDGPLPHTRKR